VRLVARFSLIHTMVPGGPICAQRRFLLVVGATLARWPSGALCTGYKELASTPEGSEAHPKASKLVGDDMRGRRRCHGRRTRLPELMKVGMVESSGVRNTVSSSKLSEKYFLKKLECG
jgi:hypothetical protein